MVELASVFFTASTASFLIYFVAAVSEKYRDEVENAFLEDDTLISLLAVDRRPVL